MEKKLGDRIFIYSDYLKQKYGKRMFRVGLSTGVECPHRLNTGGCVFCDPETFTGKYQNSDLSLQEQLEIAIPLIRSKCGDVALLAYFQDDTSTAGNPGKLKEIYQTAVDHDEIEGLIISTRPDYINREIISILSEFDLPVTIEIGLQSIHQKSLDYLNRGHDLSAVEKAIRLCAEAGIEVGVHLIFGIPGETFQDMKDTIEYVSQNSAIRSVKFHNLVIFKNTKLQEMWKEEKFKLLTVDDYIKLLGQLLPFLRGDIYITRLFTSNIRKDQVILGKFTGNKTKWLNWLRKYIYKNDIIQGSETGIVYNTKNIDQYLLN